MSMPTEAPARETTNYWKMRCTHGETPATDTAILALPWLPGIDKLDPKDVVATVRLNRHRRLEVVVEGCTVVELLDEKAETMNKLIRSLELVQPNHRWLQLTNGLPLGVGKRWWGRWIPIRTVERDPATQLTRR